MVVQSGGSRNVYVSQAHPTHFRDSATDASAPSQVGNIEDFDVYSEDKLRKDFGEYGEIELVNALREKQCCFINFTNIANSVRRCGPSFSGPSSFSVFARPQIKAIEGMKANPDYSHLKISFGKDR